MIKLSNVKWIAAAIVAGTLTLSTTSCKDNDPSLHDKQVEIWEKANDVTANGLYGRVKASTRTYYAATWENGTVKQGLFYTEITTGYDKDGYHTRSTHVKLQPSNIGYSPKLSEEYAIVSRDSKQRVTEQLQIIYSYSSTTEAVDKKTYTQTIYTYDEGAKTATAIEKQSDDNGVSYTKDVSKKVYKLNKYGRIDYDNSEEYRVEKSSFETNPYYVSVTEYDNQGNPTLRYQKYTSSDGTVSIYGYSRTVYIYY